MTATLERERFDLPRAAADGVEIFAIGDIHGRSDLLAALLEAAAREPRRAERREVVFLGDIIDRGPDTLGAIRLVLEAGERLGAGACVRLMGNHETMMRMALDPTTPRFQALEALESWTYNGGSEVIAEFAPDLSLLDDPRRVIGELRAAAPAFVTQWLAGLVPHARSGGLLFVHAGVNPRCDLAGFLAAPWNVALGRLDEGRHWAWVRGPFLGHLPRPSGHSGFFVVHGHSPLDLGFTPSHAAQIARFRLNLDGGSGQTGMAKLAIFRGARVEVLTAIGRTNREL